MSLGEDDSRQELGTKGLQTSFDTPLISARRFYGTVDLDATRLARDASKIAEEIVQHLQSILGSKVGIELQINAELPNGIPESVTLFSILAAILLAPVQRSS
jgi:hypothetical protein